MKQKIKRTRDSVALNSKAISQIILEENVNTIVRHTVHRNAKREENHKKIKLNKIHAKKIIYNDIKKTNKILK